MKVFDSGFESHIASGATTLATCWRIIRSDGAVFGFTDHDEAIEFDGVVFDPAGGLDGGETAAKLGAQVDAAEVLGIVRVDAICDDDILLGRFDGAVVETWRVNWRDPAMRHLMRRDSVGEIVREDGMFRLELRSAQHALNVPKGRIYHALCGTNLGEAPCGINLNQPHLKTTATIVTVPGRQTFKTGGLTGFSSGWFDFGRAVWTSGKRVGKTDRIVSHVSSSGAASFVLAEPIIDWVMPGDTVTLYAGCDRRMGTCKSKFSNILNFRGFPHIPGSDFVLRYPRPGGNFNGRPLFK